MNVNAIKTIARDVGGMPHFTDYEPSDDDGVEFNMNVMLSQPGQWPKECRTVCCVAGATLLRFSPNPSEGNMVEAAGYLGLRWRPALALFEPSTVADWSAVSPLAAQWVLNELASDPGKLVGDDLKDMSYILGLWREAIVRHP